MSPVLPLEFPLGPHDLRCRLWREFLSAAECAELLQSAGQRGFVSAQGNYPPSYRNNLRQVFDDPQLAQRLLPRLRAVLPDVDKDWLLDAINPRWRSCRYAPGQAFNLHQDGVFHAPDGRMSRLTFMLYLNDASEFSGGDTVFYDGPPDQCSPPQEIARVRPSAGALIVFDHTLWHAGAQVSAGLKTILRSDLLYRRRGLQPATSTASGHRGYVFCLAALDKQRYLSGGRDGTIRLYQAGSDGSAVVAQHAQSVLGLHALLSTRFAAVSRDCCLAIHDLGGSSSIINRHAHAGAVLCVTGLGERIYSGGADHQIAIWDLQARPMARLHGHHGWVWDLALLDEGRLLSVSEDQQLLYWEAGELVCTVDLGRPLRSVLYDPATGRVLVADAVGALHLLVLVEHQLHVLRRVHAHRAQIRKLRRGVDGSVLSCAEDGQIRRWDLQLDGGAVAAQREGFATDVLQFHDGLVSAGYVGGVLCHAMH